MDQPGSHTLIRGNQPAADRMRELLARTVQDQFTDQRSNAGALEDIRQRMEGLDGFGDTFGARIDGLGDMFGTRIEGLGSTVSDWLGQFDGRLETANGQFTGVSGQLETLGRGAVSERQPGGATGTTGSAGTAGFCRSNGPRRQRAPGA